MLKQPATKHRAFAPIRLVNRKWADAPAIAYLELQFDNRTTLFGVGLDASFVTASLKAIACALARAKIGRKPGPSTPEPKPRAVPDPVAFA